MALISFFDKFHSSLTGLRLLLTLTNVKRDRDKTVTAFKTFALLVPVSDAEKLSIATFEKEIGAPQPVRLFTHKDMKRVASSLKGHAGHRFFALLELRGALDSRDGVLLEKARKRLRLADHVREREFGFVPASDNLADLDFAKMMQMLTGLPPEEAVKHYEGLRPGPLATADERRLLSYEVSEAIGLLRTRLVLWSTGTDFRPAIYCSDLMTALYVHTFLIAPTGIASYRICPRCAEQFLQERSNQKYCCPAHRETHRVARFREKRKRFEAEEEEVQHGTNETQ